MSTVKISQLSQITHLNTNTSNTLVVGVDIPSGVTGKITATTLAEGLYSHNPLKVGNNEILFDHTVGQFSGEDSEYLQVNIQNFDGTGSGDYIVTANTGTNANSYIDMGINGSQYSDPEFSSMRPYDGYLYVMGPNEFSSEGNLIIGTASSNANVSVIVGGTATDNVVFHISKTGLHLKPNKTISFGDNSIQSVAAAPANYTQSAFDKANTVNAYSYSANTWLQANTGSALAAAKVYTDTANGYIQTNYLANTTGTFNGSLTLTGNINSKGLISLTNPNVTDNSIFFLITGAANNAYQPASNPGYTIHTTSIDGQGNRIVADAFGSAANNYASFIGRRGRGTAQSPTGVQSGDIIARFGGNGFGSTKFSQYGDGRIEIVANENFTDLSKRTRIDFLTTDVGSNTANIIATFNGSNATFIGVVNPQKGFIYNPNVISIPVSTLNIDIANNSLYKFSVNAAATISLSGFQYGKVVEVWINNIDNQNRAITHGCIANNSTTGTTSFTLTAQKVAHLKYFSIDGDLANTFVSINYS